MIKRYCLICVSASLLLLAGCSTAPTQPPVMITLPDGTQQETQPQEAVPQQPVEGVIVEQEPPPVMSENRAVIALLDRSKLDAGAGQREAAGSSLERALRIEPRNGWLWHELAQLRLTQGQYAQAISLSRKSNSFAGRERRLQALNWRVIGNARVAQGDSSGAEQAFKRAEELEK